MKASNYGFDATPRGEKADSLQQRLLVALEKHPNCIVTASLVVATDIENNSQYLMMGRVWLSHTDGSVSPGLGALFFVVKLYSLQL